MSKAAKKRAHRTARRLQPTQARQVAPPSLSLVNTPEPRREKTGLEWLLAKKRISRDQLRAGARYGKDFRLAEIEGMDPLRSCLNDEPRGGTGVTAIVRVEASADARQALLGARTALGFHAGMLAACDVICGRGFTPWEAVEMVGGGQRDVEKIQTTLSVALDLLGEYYRLRIS